MSQIEKVAIAFVQARIERKRAKAAFLELFHEQEAMDESYPCEKGDLGCHRIAFNRDGIHEPLPIEQWCDLCKERQLLYEAYQVAQRKQGGALRRLERMVSKNTTPEGGDDARTI